MKQLSNKNMVDILTMPISDVVDNLKNIANDEELKLCLKDMDLVNEDVKKEVEENGDEYVKRKIQQYFALRAAIYHLETIYNRPASFI